MSSQIINIELPDDIYRDAMASSSSSLEKGEAGAFTADQRAELATLRDAADRHVLRRSYALALLKWRGHALPSAPYNSDFLRQARRIWLVVGLHPPLE